MVPERIESLLSIKKGYLVIIFLIAIDLVAKFIAEEYLSFGQAVPLIPILDLLLVFNSGIAFSILDFMMTFMRWLRTSFWTPLNIPHRWMANGRWIQMKWLCCCSPVAPRESPRPPCCVTSIWSATYSVLWNSLAHQKRTHPWCACRPTISRVLQRS